MLENYHAYYDYDSCGGSCGGDCPPTPTPVYVTSVSVSPSYLSMKVGDWSYSPYAYVLPSNADNRTVRWYSNDSSIASVNSSSGYVYANSAGTTRIYAVATDGSGCRDYLTVSVSRRVLVSSVAFDHTSVTLEKGEKWQIHATICPYNADNTGLRWESSNTGIATVSNGLVTAVSRGTATITATARDGSGARAICTVYVTETIPVTSVNVSPQYKSMYRGTSSYVYATVSPSDATNSEVLWSSSDECVATVNPDSGLVWARCAGTAVIRATARDGSGVSGCCYLTVTEQILVQNIYLNHYDMTLPVNSSGILEASVCPANATNKTILWTSSNTQVASINGAGTVAARGVGTATITASTYDNSGVTACCQVTVVPVPIEKVELNKTKMILGKDEVVQLQCNVTPRNATVSTVTWESSPAYVASVSSSGAVTALADGTATVTVRVNGTYTATCEVVVDTREKVLIEDQGSYFKVTFANGRVWKSICCDLEDTSNRTYGTSLSGMYYEDLNDVEKRYVDNSVYQEEYSIQELAFIYRFDPLAIEYMMKHGADGRYTALKDKLVFKDNVYKAIFGNPVPDSFYFRIVDGEVRYITNCDNSVRDQVHSNAEILFGSYNEFNWQTFMQSLLTGLFNAIPGVSTVQTGVQVYQALFHSGSFTGLYSSQAKSYVEDYVTSPISALAEAKLGARAQKCIFWVGNLLTMLVETTLDSFVIPNLKDMVIYDTIEDQTYYNVIFKDGTEEVHMSEIIDACE